MADYIKQYYLMGLYKDVDLDTFVSAGMLSADQENEIKTAKTADASTSDSTTSNSTSTSESTSATATASETASN